MISAKTDTPATKWLYAQWTRRQGIIFPLVLREGEDVAVGIREPGDFSAAWSGPYSIFALFQERIAFELRSLARHLCYGAVDVFDLPAEYGEGCRGELADTNDANHDAVRIHHDGEGVVADESQAELLFVEKPSACRVFGGDKGDEGILGDHALTSLGSQFSLIRDAWAG